MRLLALSATVAVLSFTGVSSSHASQGAWCLRTKYTNPANCSIPTHEMCIFAALPENGSCWPNPNYRGPVEYRQPGPVRKRNSHY
jgi:hypothetical protein